jgi:peptidoglycan/LPS O-acetylase OafA/YrhL
MGWFLLIIVLIAAAFGILGAVLKLALALVLAVILSIVILGAIGYFWFKSWAKREGQSFEVHGTDEQGNTYEARGWVKRSDPPKLPDDQA